MANLRTPPPEVGSLIPEPPPTPPVPSGEVSQRSGRTSYRFRGPKMGREKEEMKGGGVDKAQEGEVLRS